VDQPGDLVKHPLRPAVRQGMSRPEGSLFAAAVCRCCLVAAYLTVTLLVVLAGVPMPLVADRMNR
jgi:hypothetical protein